MWPNEPSFSTGRHERLSYLREDFQSEQSQETSPNCAPEDLRFLLSSVLQNLHTERQFEKALGKMPNEGMIFANLFGVSYMSKKMNMKICDSRSVLSTSERDIFPHLQLYHHVPVYFKP